MTSPREAEPDRAALMALYRATNGDGWTRRDGWGTDAPLGQWYGVFTAETFGARTGDALIRVSADGVRRYGVGIDRVQYLRLTHNGLTGRIPHELGDLGALRDLDLRDNHLTGGIPHELGNLGTLEWLDLRDNHLTGSIPHELGDLGALEHLDLRDNHLTGSIPHELGDLGALEHLDLSGNELTGSIPHELGDLGALRILDLRGNQFTGGIPSELADLRELLVLDLGGNADLAEGSAEMFNLDVYRYAPSFLGGGARFPSSSVGEALALPVEQQATLHLFAVVPIDLYTDSLAASVCREFKESESKCECKRSTTRALSAGDTSECKKCEWKWECATDFPYRAALPGLDMEPAAVFRYKKDEKEDRVAGGPSDEIHAVFIRTALCLVFSGTSRLMTSDVDAAEYERAKWALRLATEPPDWVREQLRYNPRGALYRAVWLWIFQRHVRDWWAGGGRSRAEDQRTAGPGAAEAPKTVRAFATWIRNEVMERLAKQPESEDAVVVQLIGEDQPDVFAFSALMDDDHAQRVGEEVIQDAVQRERGDLGQPGPSRLQGERWREHFSATAKALELLNLIDDGVPVSGATIKEFGKDYQALAQTHQRLRMVMDNEDLRSPSESLQGGEFGRIADALVETLRPLDLQDVLARLKAQQTIRQDAERALAQREPDAAMPEWEDVQDGDRHLMLLAEPETLTLATASEEHVREVVSMEIALQAEWNAFGRAAGRVLKNKDAGEDPTRVEDDLLDDLSNQLLRVTRWRAQVSGWQRAVFERLREASGLDENIDTFYRASEESVRRSQVRREKREHRRAEKFQQRVTVGASVLAAFVLGEITISMASALTPGGKPEVEVQVVAWLSLFATTAITGVGAWWLYNDEDLRPQWRTGVLIGAAVLAAIVAGVARLWFIRDADWPSGLPLFGIGLGSALFVLWEGTCSLWNRTGGLWTRARSRFGA